MKSIKDLLDEIAETENPFFDEELAQILITCQEEATYNNASEKSEETPQPVLDYDKLPF
jgi:hypothetical protein